MEQRSRVQCWDLPVRVFHWLLVLLIAFQYLSFRIGGDWMTYHMWAGYTLLTLILFRLAWGFVGSRHARFSDFLYGPGAVMGYLKTLPQRKASVYAGHNPLGGLSVVAMILLVLLQAVTGLFANDDIMMEGPLVQRIDKETSDFLTMIHRYNYYVLVSLAGVHILAVLYYLVYKSENLVKAMVTGYKELPASLAGNGTRIAGTGVAAVVFLVAALVVYLVVRQWN